MKLLQYYPGPTIARRDAIEKNLQFLRDAMPKRMLNTQIGPGKKNLEVFIKTNIKETTNCERIITDW